MHAISASKVRELGGLNAIRPHQVILQREAMSQAHGLRTVGSGGSDEDLKVHRLAEFRQSLPIFRFESRIALGHAEDGVE